MSLCKLSICEILAVRRAIGKSISIVYGLTQGKDAASVLPLGVLACGIWRFKKVKLHRRSSDTARTTRCLFLKPVHAGLLRY